MVYGKLDIHMQNDEVGPLHYTILISKLKLNQIPKCKVHLHYSVKLSIKLLKSIKLLEENS